MRVLDLRVGLLKARRRAPARPAAALCGRRGQGWHGVLLLAAAVCRALWVVPPQRGRQLLPAAVDRERGARASRFAAHLARDAPC